MRLSRLHINGFKSFPDRAELGFDHGVTAIVGPNGCGKSNVVDAITWVLGEQSAKSLRGERMEDVIFNGSDARKPTAAAEVRLRLADVAQAAMPAAAVADEFLDEPPLVTRDVEIGRRLYRSGESEYLIDGEVCRLRDVHDLLMDSGLGVKAYAVIEQGKIGQILSSRPAERRTLIEEAAGVTKYKSRRRAAELKLEAARQNLTRIDDIIFEVEKQRSALKRQAARARRYKRLREELRRWEQVQFAHRHEALSQEIEAVESRLTGARARETGAAAHVAELEAVLEAIRLQLTEAESGATAAREGAHARELEIGRREQQIQFDKHQIEDLSKREGEIATEAEDLRGRRDPARSAVDSQRSAALKARESFDRAAENVAERESAYSRTFEDVQRAEHDADELRATVLASATTLSALRQAEENAEAIRDRVGAERTRLDVEARDLDGELQRVRASRDAGAAALAQVREALESAQRMRRDLEETLAGQRREREALGVSLLARQQALSADEARLRSFEELDARRATFGDAARYLLAEASSSLQQHGALADHLDVERSYERAVDALLGDLLQHVLVDSDREVEHALVHLEGANAGRCGFIVVGGDARPESAPAPLVVPPGARSLRDVIRVKGPHARVLSHVLGQALIVTSLDAARSLARTVSVPVATMNGEVLRGALLVEGGAHRDAHGILGVRGEIDRLREHVTAARTDVEQSTAEANRLQASIESGDGELARIVSDLHEQEKAIVAREGQVGRDEEDLARVGRRRDVVATERRRAEEEERAAEARRNEAVAAIGTHETTQRQAEATLADVLARLQAARTGAEASMRLVTVARTEHAALGERTGALETEVVRLIESARELDERIENRQAEIGRMEVRRRELRESIAATEHLLDQDIQALEGLKQEMRLVDATVVEARGQFGAKEHEIRAARHGLETVRAEVMQSEVARATAAADLTHLSTACLDAIGVPIDDVVAAVAKMERDGELVAPGKRLAAISAPDEDERDEDGQPVAAEAGAAADAVSDAQRVRTADATTPEEVIADLRQKVDRLGPVNMMAIEQFDELETRHGFLTTQRQDLLDSISQTNEAIRRIDKTTRERFEEAFASINKNFEKTFTTLFGGGRAGLVLIDQENDPESGIDIIAQPPGKRLQNVQLLSGGEKALTAMALMFAIFQHRPSPFCLLDEIDAPLDDANIGRFVEMLQGMQTHTQFILITHNRKTMEIANQLYGVTMEEPGVSKLISLQLN